jgi:hypothetical protein
VSSLWFLDMVSDKSSLIYKLGHKPSNSDSGAGAWVPFVSLPDVSGITSCEAGSCGSANPEVSVTRCDDGRAVSGGTDSGGSASEITPVKLQAWARARLVTNWSGSCMTWSWSGGSCASWLGPVSALVSALSSSASAMAYCGSNIVAMEVTGVQLAAEKM